MSSAKVINILSRAPVRLFLSYEDFTDIAKPTSSAHLWSMIVGFVVTLSGILFIVPFSFQLALHDVLMAEHLWILCFCVVMAIPLVFSTYSFYSYDPYEISMSEYLSKPYEIRENLESAFTVLSFWFDFILSALFLIPLSVYIYIYTVDNLISLDATHRVTFYFLIFFLVSTFVWIITQVIYLVRRVSLINALGSNKAVFISEASSSLRNNSSYTALFITNVSREKTI